MVTVENCLMTRLTICILPIYYEGISIKEYKIGAARIGDMRNVYKILVGNQEGKKSSVSFTCTREGNINMNVKNTVWC